MALRSDFKRQLAEHGVTTPEQYRAVEQLKALGFGNGQILQWLADHKDGILSILQLVLAAAGKGKA